MKCGACTVPAIPMAAVFLVMTGVAPLASAAPPQKGKAKTVEKAPASAAVTAMSLEVFFPKQQENAVLVYDARPSFVRKFGHIPGSIGWPRSAFDSDWAKREPEIRAAVAKKTPVVIYCTDLECPDARAVAEKIAAKGYPVSVLTGGYHGWKEAGMPVE